MWTRPNPSWHSAIAPTRATTRGVFLLAVICIALGGALTRHGVTIASPPETKFLYDGSLYSYDKGSDCLKERRDPIGIVFHGSGASERKIAGGDGRKGIFRRRTGWGTTWPVTRMLYYSHGRCYGDVRQYAKDHGWGRNHIRLWEQPFVKFRMMGTPHFEMQCPTGKHGVVHYDKDGNDRFRTPQGGRTPSGFDYARLLIHDKFSRHSRYKVRSTRWGNTDWSFQCKRAWKARKGPYITRIIIGK